MGLSGAGPVSNGFVQAAAPGNSNPFYPSPIEGPFGTPAPLTKSYTRFNLVADQLPSEDRPWWGGQNFMGTQIMCSILGTCTEKDQPNAEPASPPRSPTIEAVKSNLGPIVMVAALGGLAFFLLR